MDRILTLADDPALHRLARLAVAAWRRARALADDGLDAHAIARALRGEAPRAGGIPPSMLDHLAWLVSIWPAGLDGPPSGAFIAGRDLKVNCWTVDIRGVGCIEAASGVPCPMPSRVSHATLIRADGAWRLHWWGA